MNYWVDTDRIFWPTQKPHLPLIHMTQDWETLKLILNQGFKPSYCTENITNGKETKTACFPMISLSNMAIDNAMRSQKSYGTMGVALTKKWGEENDFNPVLYLDRKSDLTNEIIEAFKHIMAGSIKELNYAVTGTNTSYVNLLRRYIIKLFAHSKNYDGQLVRGNTLYAEEYPFGLEREWRKIIKIDGAPYFLAGEDILKKDAFNENISNLRFDFEIHHLEGIIVETIWQLEDVKEIIKKKYNLNEFPKGIDVTINPTRHVPED